MGAAAEAEAAAEAAAEVKAAAEKEAAEKEAVEKEAAEKEAAERAAAEERAAAKKAAEKEAAEKEAAERAAAEEGAAAKKAAAKKAAEEGAAEDETMEYPPRGTRVGDKRHSPGHSPDSDPMYLLLKQVIQFLELTVGNILAIRMHVQPIKHSECVACTTLFIRVLHGFATTQGTNRERQIIL